MNDARLFLRLCMSIVHRPYLHNGSKQLHTSCRYLSKSPETELAKQMKARIKMNGPVTVAQYMSDVLTNPSSGYYMHKDVFGAKGDFITSPEISQIFGELLGIWCVNEWMQCGSPNQLQLVELGPGRGTLADDMLRVFSQFEGIKDAVSMHFVEVSPTLSAIQEQKLCGTNGAHSDHSHKTGESTIPTSDTFYKKSLSKYGSEVFWYDNLRKVPHRTSCFIAHEFFDALPIHKFQKQDGRWHEVLIDVDESSDNPHHFRYVLSRSPTTASSILLKVNDNDPRQHIELCPSGAVVVQELAHRIKSHGGFSLIVDYGHSGEKEDTFRGFREHELFEALQEPGTADLTADVDFAYLAKMVSQQVSTYGPVTQQNYLKNMGIGTRLQVLMRNAPFEERKNLMTGFDMLTNPEKMGERFKVFAMLPKQNAEYCPAGFNK